MLSLRTTTPFYLPSLFQILTKQVWYVTKNLKLLLTYKNVIFQACLFKKTTSPHDASCTVKFIYEILSEERNK